MDRAGSNRSEAGCVAAGEGEREKVLGASRRAPSAKVTASGVTDGKLRQNAERMKAKS